MKFLISLIIIIICHLSLIKCLQTCSQSYECGNMPYSICENKFNIFQGIGVDPIEGKVFVIGKFNSSGLMYGNVTLASVPISGSGVIKSEFTIKSDVTTGSAFRNTNKLTAYSPKSKTFLIQGGERLSNVVGIYNDNAQINFNPLWYPRGFTLGIYFDEINQLTYSCEFDIRVFPKIVKTQDEIYGSGSGGAVVLNNGTQCFGISNALKNINNFNNTVLYATLNQDSSNKNTVFYMGSANCVLCKRPFSAIYTYNQWITGFHVYNNLLYFSSKQGIFQLNVPGANKPLVISNDPVDSFEFVDSENTIYYTTAGKIKKVNAKTLAVTILYDSSNDKFLGICSCAYGFTGAKCDQCTDGTVQWQDGNPTCVKKNYKGAPESCQADWQCGNSPYFLCMNNECLCRSEFFGNKCDQCQGTLSWSNGIPVCTPTYPI